MSFEQITCSTSRLQENFSSSNVVAVHASLQRILFTDGRREKPIELSRSNKLVDADISKSGQNNGSEIQVLPQYIKAENN